MLLARLPFLSFFICFSARFAVERGSNRRVLAVVFAFSFSSSSFGTAFAVEVCRLLTGQQRYVSDPAPTNFWRLTGPGHFLILDFIIQSNSI